MQTTPKLKFGVGLHKTAYTYLRNNDIRLYIKKTPAQIIEQEHFK